MKKSYLKGVLCTALTLISMPITAIEIVPFGGAFEYQWYTEAEAIPVGSGIFHESDSSIAIVQYGNWFGLPSINYSGGVVSPVSGKTYDTSPILFQQPDGSYEATATFNESWTHSDAGVGVNESFGAGRYSLGIDSASNAVAHHALDSYFFGSTGEASASASARVNTSFNLDTLPGEASTFTLNMSYFQNVFADVLLSAGAGSPDFNSHLALTASIELRNVTTGDHLFNYLYDGSKLIPPSFQPWSSTNGEFHLEGLSTEDTYWIEILLDTHATARSSSEIIFEDPSCVPEINSSCVVTGTNYYDEDSIVSTALDFNLEAVATVVPIPPAVWLFGSGLLGLIAVARRKTHV